MADVPLLGYTGPARPTSLAASLAERRGQVGFDGDTLGAVTSALPMLRNFPDVALQLAQMSANPAEAITRTQSVAGDRRYQVLASAWAERFRKNPQKAANDWLRQSPADIEAIKAQNFDPSPIVDFIGRKGKPGLLDRVGHALTHNPVSSALGKGFHTISETGNIVEFFGALAEAPAAGTGRDPANNPQGMPELNSFDDFIPFHSDLWKWVDKHEVVGQEALNDARAMLKDESQLRLALKLVDAGGSLDELAAEAGDFGSPAYVKRYQTLVDQTSDPNFQKAMQRLGTGVFRAGVMTANATPFKPGSAPYAVTAAAGELYWSIKFDPLIAAGKLRTGYKAWKTGIDAYHFGSVDAAIKSAVGVPEVKGLTGLGLYLGERHGLTDLGTLRSVVARSGVWNYEDALANLDAAAAAGGKLNNFEKWANDVSKGVADVHAGRGNWWDLVTRHPDIGRHLDSLQDYTEKIRFDGREVNPSDVVEWLRSSEMFSVAKGEFGGYMRDTVQLPHFSTLDRVKLAAKLKTVGAIDFAKHGPILAPASADQWMELRNQGIDLPDLMSKQVAPGNIRLFSVTDENGHSLVDNWFTDDFEAAVDAQGRMGAINNTLAQIRWHDLPENVAKEYRGDNLAIPARFTNDAASEFFLPDVRVRAARSLALPLDYQPAGTRMKYYASRLLVPAGSLTYGLTHNVPKGGWLALDNPDTFRQLEDILSMGLRRSEQRQIIGDFLADRSLGARRLIADSALRTMFTRAGVFSTDTGTAWAEDLLDRRHQKYALGVLDQLEGRPNGVWFVADRATAMAMPEYDQLLAHAKRNAFLDVAYKSVNNRMFDSFMSVWRPSVLLRPAFALRVASDEAMSFLFHHGPHVMMNQYVWVPMAGTEDAARLRLLERDIVAKAYSGVSWVLPRDTRELIRAGILTGDGAIAHFYDGFANAVSRGVRAVGTHAADPERLRAARIFAKNDTAQRIFHEYVSSMGGGALDTAMESDDTFELTVLKDTGVKHAPKVVRLRAIGSDFDTYIKGDPLHVNASVWQLKRLMSDPVAASAIAAMNVFVPEARARQAASAFADHGWFRGYFGDDLPLDELPHAGYETIDMMREAYRAAPAKARDSLRAYMRTGDEAHLSAATGIMRKAAARGRMDQVFAERLGALVEKMPQLPRDVAESMLFDPNRIYRAINDDAAWSTIGADLFHGTAWGTFNGDLPPVDQLIDAGAFSPWGAQGPGFYVSTSGAYSTHFAGGYTRGTGGGTSAANPTLYQLSWKPGIAPKILDMETAPPEVLAGMADGFRSFGDEVRDTVSALDASKTWPQLFRETADDLLGGWVPSRWMPNGGSRLADLWMQAYHSGALPQYATKEEAYSAFLRTWKEKIWQPAVDAGYHAVFDNIADHAIGFSPFVVFDTDNLKIVGKANQVESETRSLVATHQIETMADLAHRASRGDAGAADELVRNVMLRRAQMPDMAGYIADSERGWRLRNGQTVAQPVAKGMARLYFPMLSPSDAKAVAALAAQKSTFGTVETSFGDKIAGQFTDPRLFTATHFLLNESPDIGTLWARANEFSDAGLVPLGSWSTTDYNLAKSLAEQMPGLNEYVPRNWAVGYVDVPVDHLGQLRASNSFRTGDTPTEFLAPVYSPSAAAQAPDRITQARGYSPGAKINRTNYDPRLADQYLLGPELLARATPFDRDVAEFLPLSDNARVAIERVAVNAQARQSGAMMAARSDEEMAVVAGDTWAQSGALGIAEMGRQGRINTEHYLDLPSGALFKPIDAWEHLPLLRADDRHTVLGIVAGAYPENARHRIEELASFTDADWQSLAPYWNSRYQRLGEELNHLGAGLSADHIRYDRMSLVKMLRDTRYAPGLRRDQLDLLDRWAPWIHDAISGHGPLNPGDLIRSPGVSQYDAIADAIDVQHTRLRDQLFTKADGAPHSLLRPLADREFSHEHALQALDNLPDEAIGMRYVEYDPNIFQRIVRYGFDKVVGPMVDGLIRRPLFQENFYRKLRDTELLRPMFTNEALVAKGRDVAATHGLDFENLGDLKALPAADRRAILDARKHLDSVDRQLSDIALQGAVNDSIPFIDDHRVRSQFSRYVRNLSPFWFAEEQFVKRWARVLVHDPEVLRAAQLTLMGLRHGGLVYKNDFGEDTFAYPGSQLMMDVLAKPIEHVFGKKYSMPVSAALTGNIFYISPGLDKFAPGASVLPGVSPVLTVPVTLLGRRFPELESTTLYHQVLGRAEGRSLPEQIMPSSFVRIYDAITKDAESNAQFASASFAVMQMMEAQGLAPKPDADEHEIEQYLERVQNWTRITLLSRAILGTALPASPQISFQDNLRPEFAKLLKSAPDYATALQEFMRRHPDANAFTVFQTKAPSGAPIPATASAFKLMTNNANFFDKYPMAAPWLVPDTGEGFDRRAWNEELAKGLRVRKSPRDTYDEFKYKAASGEYFTVKQQVDAVIAALPERDPRKQQVREVWGKFRDEYFAQNPLFEKLLTGGAARQRRAQILDQTVTMLNDPALPQTPVTNALAELVTMYQSVQGIRDGLRYDGTVRADNIKKGVVQAFSTYGDAFATEHPEVRPFWERVIAPELGIDPFESDTATTKAA